MAVNLPTSPSGENGPDGVTRQAALERQYYRSDNYVQSLQASTTIIIQLSVIGLIAGVASFKTEPISFTLIPIVLDTWYLYLLALDRQTREGILHRKWIAAELNELYNYPTFLWDDYVEGEKSTSASGKPPGAAGVETWMLYALYSIAAISSIGLWIGGAFVVWLYLPASWGLGVIAAATIGYSIVGLIIHLLMALSIRYNTRKLVHTVTRALDYVRIERSQIDGAK